MNDVELNSKLLDRNPREQVLLDRFGRVHRSLRISVTEVCNIRCQYCMPEDVQFQARESQLSYEQIAAFVKATVQFGISNLRLTGGEPLLRPRLHELVHLLSNIDGVEDLALTTNGMLLAEQLPGLVEAGLQRVNISLDTLSEENFRRLSRRNGLDRVLAGINAAVETPGVDVKLNALVLRDVNFEDVLKLVEFALERQVTLRFIEFMPLDGDRNWSKVRMVSGAELRELISARFGTLSPITGSDPSQPASDYTLSGGRGKLGFIDSVSEPFCGNCDRLRLTADGKIRNCLFGREEWDVAELLRSRSADAHTADDKSTDEALRQVLRKAVRAKHAAHGIADEGFQPPERAMYQIGG